MNKTLPLALLAVASATTANAGGLSPVVVETVPVIEEKAPSSLSPLVILGIILLIGFAISQNDDDPGTPTPPTPPTPNQE